eukprot:TRINITY_DN4042_c0_g1_i11.p1 TRINITY_DN4042_c0_g1~~TRINITY_DN4042_c0_g1_i11.p1  ORF type:complete len:797 (+),score=107.86 TRINITY_DN4042_c0_g1_i11:132-2522(+)
MVAQQHRRIEAETAERCDGISSTRSQESSRSSMGMMLDMSELAERAVSPGAWRTRAMNPNSTFVVPGTQRPWVRETRRKWHEYELRLKSGQMYHRLRTVQAVCRRFITAKRTKDRNQQRDHAARTLQRHWRAFLHRCYALAVYRVRQVAVCRVQAWVRRMLAQLRVACMREYKRTIRQRSASLIQKCFRRHNLVRRVASYMLKAQAKRRARRIASTHIKSMCQAASKRRLFRILKRFVRHYQRFLRFRRNAACRKIQAEWHRHHGRQALRAIHRRRTMAAVKLQRQVRRRWVWCEVKPWFAAVTAMSRMWRGITVRRKLIPVIAERRRAVINIQAWIRRNKLCRAYQRVRKENHLMRTWRTVRAKAQDAQFLASVVARCRNAARRVDAARHSPWFLGQPMQDWEAPEAASSSLSQSPDESRRSPDNVSKAESSEAGDLVFDVEVQKGLYGLGIAFSLNTSKITITSFKAMPSGVENPALVTMPPLEVGDRIVAVNGVACGNARIFSSTVSSSGPVVTLTIERLGDEEGEDYRDSESILTELLGGDTDKTTDRKRRLSETVKYSVVQQVREAEKSLTEAADALSEQLNEGKITANEYETRLDRVQGQADREKERVRSRIEKQEAAQAKKDELERIEAERLRKEQAAQRRRELLALPVVVVVKNMVCQEEELILRLTAGHLVSELKAMVARRTKIPAEEQRILCLEVELVDNSCTLMSYGIGEGDNRRCHLVLETLASRRASQTAAEAEEAIEEVRKEVSKGKRPTRRPRSAPIRPRRHTGATNTSARNNGTRNRAKK